MKNHEITTSIKTSQANNSKFSFKVFWALLLASILASLSTIPYASALLYQKTSSPPMSEMLIGGLLNFVVLTVPLTSLGLWLGSKVGLGTPELETILTKVPPNYRRFRSSILSAIILGVVGGIFIHAISILYQPYLPSELMKTKSPGFLKALLSSFGAAVNEEIWLRLGIMTCLVFLGSKLMGQPRPSRAIIWSANLLAAIGFGMLHLPLLANLVEELSPSIVIFVLLLNGFIGVIYGWLYWRRGLLAAMIAHFSTDLIIHVVPALFSTGSR